MEALLLTILWPALAYLLGAFPFGLLVGKALCNQDVRAAGSRNTGATNVARLCGFRVGVIVLAMDLLKGLIPVAMAATFSHSAAFLSATALAAVLGHDFSVFLDGKGGKGVATTLGVALALAFTPTVLAIVLGVAVIAASGFVSLGSLAMGAAIPLFALLAGCWGLVPVLLVLAALLYWKHRENIERLARGEEKPWRKKKE